MKECKKKWRILQCDGAESAKCQIALSNSENCGEKKTSKEMQDNCVVGAFFSFFVINSLVNVTKWTSL